jgi:hypothetical protein
MFSALAVVGLALVSLLQPNVAFGAPGSASSDVSFIQVSPLNWYVYLGESVVYRADAYGKGGIHLGDVTSSTSFAFFEGIGTCTGNRCTPNAVGTHGVIASYEGHIETPHIWVRAPLWAIPDLNR